MKSPRAWMGRVRSGASLPVIVATADRQSDEPGVLGAE
jgi:hypothetical protein